mmetsp:Transcript_16164/g.41551  ORF Transcript_16164/g.41551 Transcript_16164/m.41551 type:complete len:207 (+) Transcript_16164:1324-1944(+)
MLPLPLVSSLIISSSLRNAPGSMTHVPSNTTFPNSSASHSTPSPPATAFSFTTFALPTGTFTCTRILARSTPPASFILRITSSACTFAGRPGATANLSSSRMARSTASAVSGRWVRVSTRRSATREAISWVVLVLACWRSLLETWRAPDLRISRMMSSRGRGPKAAERSLEGAREPLETLVKTEWVWRTSSRSASLPSRQETTLLG